MTLQVWVAFGIALAFLAWYDWLYRVVLPRQINGDLWYIRRFAFTSGPVSPPYCWRPLVPWLARIVGFRFVTYLSSVATAVLIAWWLGGWAGVALAAAFCGNTYIFRFNINHPEYAEGLGHLLLAASAMSMSCGHWSAWPLLFLSALCRETLTLALGAVAVFWGPWLLIPLALGSAVARLSRKPDLVNRHPLVSESVYETFKYIAGYKKSAALSFNHVVQPLRGFGLCVPFVWQQVEGFARLGLVGCLAVWVGAFPASGQSRIICYQFIFLAPFVAALPIEWCWLLCLLNIFWPAELNSFDETGGQKGFRYYGQPAMQSVRSPVEPSDGEPVTGRDDV